MQKLIFLFALSILLLLSGCGEADFYNYMGYRDWYRFPLKYPYQGDVFCKTLYSNEF